MALFIKATKTGSVGGIVLKAGVDVKGMACAQEIFVRFTNDNDTLFAKFVNTTIDEIKTVFKVATDTIVEIEKISDQDFEAAKSLPHFSLLKYERPTSA